MKSYILKITLTLLLVLGMLTPRIGHAEGFGDSDKFAHFGVSFAMNMALYGLYKKMFRMSERNKWNALLLSSLTSLTIGFAKEAIDVIENPSPNARFDTKDMLANTAGVAVSSGIILSFDF